MVPPVAPHFSRQHRCLTQLHFPAPSLLLSLFRHVYGLDGCSVVLLLTLSQAMGSRLSSSEPKNEIQPRKWCFGSIKQLFKPFFHGFCKCFSGKAPTKRRCTNKGSGNQKPPHATGRKVTSHHFFMHTLDSGQPQQVTIQ